MVITAAAKQYGQEQLNEISNTLRYLGQDKKAR